MLNKYEGFIFDLDGTIYLGDQIIPRAEWVINCLKKNGKRIIFVSNKTTGTIYDYYQFLTSNGFETKEHEIINSTEITAKFLNTYHPNKKFFAIGETKFIEEIEKSGLKYSEDSNEIDIVLVTLDRTLNYLKLEIAANALDKGARFFAANIDNTCPINGGEILDAGSTISALELRTNRKLEKYFGKPSKYMMKEVLKRLELKNNKCLIIGDRLETDIAMGNEFNIDTALVNTGVVKHSNSNGIFQPTYRLNSVVDLIK
jgi:NagD protein